MTDYNKFFKAYDVRGTWPEITPELFYWIGFGLISEVLQKENLSTKINLAHDIRYSSEDLYKAFYNGVLDAGGSVIPLGLASSDFLYAACQVFDNPGGIITASHNPKDDNGVKIVKGEANMLGLGHGLEKIRDFVVQKIKISEPINSENWLEPKTDEVAKSKVMDYFRQKLEQIGQISQINKTLKSQNRKIKIAVDTGNAMGGFVMPIIKQMYENIEFVEMFWEMDGNFPNHPADPQKFENLKDLQEVILTDKKVEFGMAFDGDADRVFFVDDNAKVVQGDFLVAFFAQSLLREFHKNPNPKFNPAVVYIQPGSRCVPEIIAENEGIAIPAEQGHASIKTAMSDHKAIYGGEFSGHHYFSDFGFMDSGIIAAVLMIKIVVLENRKISDIFANLNQTYFISDLQALKIPANQTFEDFKNKIKAHFRDANRISEFDGISVFYPTWKFSMRSSNTEPVVRFILESRFENIVAQKLELVRSVIGI
jgi:phosphomannomutase